MAYSTHPLEESFLEMYGSVDIEKSDLLGLFVRGHLTVEAVLSEVLEAHFMRKEYVAELRLGFASKVRMLAGLGSISPEAAKLMLVINRIRNELAHDLRKRLDQTDADRCWAAAPEWMKDPGTVREYSSAFPQSLVIPIVMAFVLATMGLQDLHRFNTALDKVRQRGRDLLEKHEKPSDV